MTFYVQDNLANIDDTRSNKRPKPSHDTHDLTTTASTSNLADTVLHTLLHTNKQSTTTTSSTTNTTNNTTDANYNITATTAASLPRIISDELRKQEALQDMICKSIAGKK